jgi:hypothetical protein
LEAFRIHLNIVAPDDTISAFGIVLPVKFVPDPLWREEDEAGLAKQQLLAGRW